MNPLSKWAWEEYDRIIRTEPNTPQSRAAWKIHIAAIRRSDMPATRQAKRASTIEIVTVASVSDMDTPTFAKHFSKRHKNSLADQYELPANIPFEVEQQYRSFHRRLHAEEGHRYRHEHEPENMADIVDYTIECLIENRNWGWKQISGVTGHVAVFPDEKKQIATRVDGKVIYHDTIEDATDRLVD